MLENVKVTVTDVGGTYRDVANAARTTINMAEGDKERALLQQQKCRAEGKLDKVDNYLRIVYGEGVDRYGKY